EIRRVDAVTGTISRVAGTGTAGAGGDNYLALAAQLDFPLELALDGLGNLYVADNGNNSIRRVDAEAQGISHGATVSSPRGLALYNGVLCVGSDAGVCTVDTATGAVGLVPGSGSLVAQGAYVTGVALDSAGLVYAATSYGDVTAVSKLAHLVTSIDPISG